MVKHTQTIRRLLPTNRLSVFGPFVGFLWGWREKVKSAKDSGIPEIPWIVVGFFVRQVIPEKRWNIMAWPDHTKTCQFLSW